MEELGMDHRACEAFGDLVNSSSAGYLEACRILAHGIKIQKSKAWHKSPSDWMVKSVQEAQNALDNWK
eukprot:5485798-Pyramimonas_sp.AAC.1